MTIKNRLHRLENPPARGVTPASGLVVIYDPATGDEIRRLSPTPPQPIRHDGQVVIYIPQNNREDKTDER